MLNDLTLEGINLKRQFLSKARDELVLLEAQMNEKDSLDGLIDVVISNVSNQMGDRFIDKNFEFIDAVRKELKDES